MTDDVEPIKIKWDGDARSKFKGRSVRARVADGGKHGERTLETLDRLKTRVVVKTEREAEALESMLENQARTRYVWTTDAHVKAYRRVLDELRDGMTARNWGDHGDALEGDDQGDDRDVDEQIGEWELQWQSGGNVRYVADGLVAKLSSHAADDHNKGTYSASIGDGMTLEKIADSIDDRDRVLDDLLDFVATHSPADARQIVEGDRELDVDDQDVDDVSDEQILAAFADRGGHASDSRIGLDVVGSAAATGELRNAGRFESLERRGLIEGTDQSPAHYRLTEKATARYDVGENVDEQDDRDDAPFEGDVEGEPADCDGAHVENDTFVLVACSSLKAADEDDDVDEDDALPAREQYRGSLFKKSTTYAETIDAPYAILSGKYGVLEPGDEIEYYDVSVRDRDADEWGDQVVAGSGMTGPQGLRWLRLSRYDELVVFAGKAYREPIGEYLDALEEKGVDVRVPLDGASGIGDMLSDMNDLLDELEGDAGDDGIDEQDVDERASELEEIGLSGREAEVTAWKEQGLTHAAIADEIGKSKSTVDEYSRRASKKFEKARALVDAADDVYS